MNLAVGTRVLVELNSTFISPPRASARGTVLEYQPTRGKVGNYLVRLELPAGMWDTLEPYLFSDVTYPGWGKQEAAWFQENAVTALSLLDLMAEAAEAPNDRCSRGPESLGSDRGQSVGGHE